MMTLDETKKYLADMPEEMTFQQFKKYWNDLLRQIHGNGEVK